MKTLPFKPKRYSVIKRICILLILIISFTTVIIQPTYTYCATPSIVETAEGLEQNVSDVLEDIDFTLIEETIAEFDNNQVKMFSLGNIKDKIYSIINGEQAVDYTTMLEVLLNAIMQLIVQYVPMFALIIGIGIIASLLGQIKSKFNEKSTADIVHFVCFCLIVVIMATSVKRLITSTTSTINSMKNIIDAIFPIILTLMTSLGEVSSVGVFQPILAIMSTIISTVILRVIVPIFIFSFVLNVIGHLSNNIKLDKFNIFLTSIFKWIIGITFTIFFAVISIQGITAGSFDSISIRTAKFTVSSYVPIMGGYLSQGMDLIMASGVLIKNSIGLVGILIIISSILSPILEIAIFSLMLKAVSAILQPLNNNRITNFLHNSSKSIIMLSTCIIVVSFMYFLCIGMCMASANVI